MTFHQQATWARLQQELEPANARLAWMPLVPADHEGNGPLLVTVLHPVTGREPIHRFLLMPDGRTV